MDLRAELGGDQPDQPDACPKENLLITRLA